VLATIGQVLGILQANTEVVTVVASLLGPEAAILVPNLITLAGLAYAAYARVDDHNKGVK
jgi:hypothetical protein